MKLPYLDCKMPRLCRNSGGISLVELLIALAIGSIVSVGALAAVNQILVQAPKARNHILATSQAQAAGYWIDQDGTGAQTITPTPNLFTLSAGTPLVISRIGWNGNKTTVTYFVDTDNILQRQEVVTNETTGSTISSRQTQMANSISSITAKYDYPTGNDIRKILVLTVTARVGSGAVASDNVTRMYSVSPRPY